MPRRRYSGSTPASPRLAPISSPNATSRSPSYTPIVIEAKSKLGRPQSASKSAALDVDAADVVLLLGRGDGEHGVEVGGGVRRGGQAGGKIRDRCGHGGH